MKERKGGKEIAQDFMDMINVMGNDKEVGAFVDEVLNSHRTLQQSAAGAFLKVFAGWAEVHDSGYYDLRNEATVKVGKLVTEATENTYLPFV